MKKTILLILSAIMLLGLTACGSKTESSPKTISEIILSQERMADFDVQLEEKLRFSKKIDGHTWHMQGGDNDGKYGYFAINDGGDIGKSVTKIYKIDLATWEIVQISDGMFAGHANDVTYIPDTHQLMITSCETFSADTAFIVDADTLEPVDTVEFSCNHGSMSYCPERKQYVIANWGKPKTLSIYDENLVEAYTIPYVSGHASQCLESDKDLIYYLMSPSVKDANEGYLLVFTWDGDFFQYITFSIPYECENVSFYGDKMILAVNDHHEEKTIRFYEMTITAQK